MRFFDQTCRAMGWSEDIAAGAVGSISFGLQEAPPPSLDEHDVAAATTLETFAAAVPNFAVATTSGSVVLVTTGSELAAELVTHFQADAVAAMAAHPQLPRVAVAGRGGMIQVWDYEQGGEVCSRSLGAGLVPSAMSYSPDGHILALGFADGQLWLLDALALAPLTERTRFRVANDSVTQLVFSQTGEYLASTDADRCVTLYRLEPADFDAPWQYVGKHRAHTRRIVNVFFLVGTGSLPRLLSLGEDGMLAEYNLADSGFSTHLVLDERTAVDQRESRE